jgi:hypothetical protein
MIDKITAVFIMALSVTALGIALRPGSAAPALASNILSGFAGVQRAAYGS